MKFILTKGMEELIMCFTKQNLNEYPWCISLGEYLKLKRVLKQKELIK